MTMLCMHVFAHVSYVCMSVCLRIPFMLCNFNLGMLEVEDAKVDGRDRTEIYPSFTISLRHNRPYAHAAFWIYTCVIHFALFGLGH